MTRPFPGAALLARSRGSRPPRIAIQGERQPIAGCDGDRLGASLCSARAANPRQCAKNGQSRTSRQVALKPLATRYRDKALSEWLMPRQALTASSRSTPSRRTAGSRSPLRARAMMRFARTALSSWLSSVRPSLPQTSSRAIDIALISHGPKTSSPKRRHRRSLFFFRGAEALATSPSLSFANASLSGALAAYLHVPAVQRGCRA